MFDWLGFQQRMKLRASWRLNRKLKDDVKEVFEGIAETRKELLTSWTQDYWRHLDWLGTQIASAADLSEDRSSPTGATDKMLASAYAKGSDWTELFVLDEECRVIASTFKPHVGTAYGNESALAPGLKHAGGAAARRCLFGPFVDARTLEIGPRSSSFHDKVTLMFIYPLVADGRTQGYLCGRVPNDVIGDLIQRESGHIYPDSGDNYLFMAKPSLNGGVAPGTALSRSRFEDRTFTGGENLKDGVTTAWGIVSVAEHTELELVFTDPADGELHTGIRNTIRDGSHLYVEHPGYCDYRHIPVIGKGVTFQLPHCPDVWGMMCEADLEEVYRIRSIGWRHFRLQGAGLAVQSLSFAAAGYFIARADSPALAAVTMFALCLLSGLIIARLVNRKATARVTGNLRGIIRFIRSNAEGKGDLTQRLAPGELDNDETRELAKWINNLIDTIEGIMIQVKAAAGDVMSSQQVLLETAQTTEQSTEQVAHNVNGMISSIRGQLEDIDVATDAFDRMQVTLMELERESSRQIGVVLEEVDRIGGEMHHISTKVGETHVTIRQFMATIQQISGILLAIEDISQQTNLLALNASIEAARVGEQGKGFAVVASEIRKLANRTRQSTDEVVSIIQLIQQNAHQAYASMDEGSLVIEQSNRLAEAASDKLAAVKAEEGKRSRAVEEAISEVVGLMNRISAISQENRRVSRSVEDNVQLLTGDISQVRHTSQSVKAITTLLQHLVGQFRMTESRLR
ncbi:methyl-accepting chemotaxis protein [Paenibacillus sp. T1]|uniref:Methyl-accepting chemotaxis protein n=2 Tax=Paenibacillus glycinis TaxID=2697035 RepID=A0ABW9XQA4_9BACL|nr:methyl-accepting chemotaxis protein [Paenibacillus glycinis]